MSPKALILEWILAFNSKDHNKLASMYHEDAVNFQVAVGIQLKGREAIREMFKDEFSRYQMVCIKENLFEDGEWAILEWKDPLGLRGCGFFHVVDEKIKFQRGYWDRLSFMEQQETAGKGV